MLTLLIVILHDLDRLPALLTAWKEANVPGVTLLPSAGGFEAEKLGRRSGLAGLLKMLDQSGAPQRLIFSLIDDPEILEIAISEADRVVHGFDSPHSGILFTLEIGQALGLQKWSRKAPIDPVQIPDDDELLDKGTANLLSWYEEKLKNLYDRKELAAWKDKRSLLVSDLLKTAQHKPTIVPVDTALPKVIAAFLGNRDVPLACVINSEERLVGLIEERTLAEIMLIPTMPEKFIQDPEGFEQALQYAKIAPKRLASDIMREAAYVSLDSTIEQAFIEMQQHGLSGLPVVNKHYRVNGYLTLLELLAVYYATD